MRPQLTAKQADAFRPDEVLRYTGTAGVDRADPWAPKPMRLDGLTPDYIVGAGAYASVQSAINAALGAGWTRRIIIGVAPGSHTGLIYVPSTPFAITLTGLGTQADQTCLCDNIDAEMEGTEFAARFAQHFTNAPAAVSDIYRRIAARHTITTGNAAVLRIESANFQLHNLTVRNTYHADRKQSGSHQRNAAGQYVTGQHQAVAVHVAGADRVQMQDVVLRSFQDTLYLQSPAKGETTRTHLLRCDIEGDVDFIFGQSTAWFENCTIRSLTTRTTQSWAVAPSTDIRTRFGFVFHDCHFTHDTVQSGTMHLGRQWFEGVRATPFGVSPIAGYQCDVGPTSNYDAPIGQISRQTLNSVGKCVILNSRISPHIAPWDCWGGPQWTPRYRPALFTASDMFKTLAPWFSKQGLSYDDIDPNMVFLGEFNTR